MLCPWCNGEMREGFLQSARPVIFTPELQGTWLVLPEGAVRLTKGFWRLPRAAAWQCPACKRVVVEYE